MITLQKTIKGRLFYTVLQMLMILPHFHELVLNVGKRPGIETLIIRYLKDSIERSKPLSHSWSKEGNTMQERINTKRGWRGGSVCKGILQPGPKTRVQSLNPFQELSIVTSTCNPKAREAREFPVSDG